MHPKRKKRPITTDASLLKQINYARILNVLRRNPHTPRAEIARFTGLTRSTVTIITAELIDQGLLIEGMEPIANDSGGRPGIALDLNPDGAFFIGATISSDTLTVIEMNFSAQVVNRIREPLGTNRDPNSVIQRSVSLIQQICQANPLSEKRLRGIGFTLPGTLNLDGVVIRAPELGWQTVPLRSLLDPHVELPLFVDSAANAIALAEVYLGSAIDCSSSLYLLLDVSVSGGIVIDDCIYRGAYGAASNVSALVVDPGASHEQDNSKAGTMDALVAKGSLLRCYRERSSSPNADLNKFVDQLKAGNAIAHTVAQKWARSLGWGIINLVNILNPERVVLGGQLTVLLPYVKDEIDTMLRDYVLGTEVCGFFNHAKSRLEVSALGDDSAAIGGAVLAYQSLFQVPDLVSLQR